MSTKKSSGLRTLSVRFWSVVAFMLALTYGIAPAQAAGIRYAKPAATGTGDCSSWANACTLQTALTGAVSGNEIWAVAGTYKPTTVPTDRSATFQIKSGVSLYGGFAGTETARDQRWPAGHVTILSGDIDNNDSQTPIITSITSVTGNTTNSYHVVSAASGAIRLEGFTVTAGYTTGSGNPDGGGMYNNSDIALMNVIFRGNFASGVGGGMASYFGSPVLTDVTFWNNRAANAGSGGTGGGLFNHFGSPALTNVTFEYNSATGTGGGWHDNYGVNPILTNVTFFGNSALDGSAIQTFSSSPTLTNVTLSANQTPNTLGGCGMSNSNGSNPQIRNAIFWNNTDHLGNQYQLCGSSVVSDSVVQGGCPGGSTCTNMITADPLLGSPSSGFGEGYTQSTFPLQPGSSALNAGNDSVCPATDQRGVPRPQGAHCDIGALEVDSTPPAVSAIVRTGPNPTTAASVNFLVTFSEPVVGVDATDFTLSTTGLSGAAVGTVTGSGTTWTVLVNTGTGGGTIRLDVGAFPGMWDIAGNQLSEAFTSGETYTVIETFRTYLPLLLLNQP